MVRNLTADSWTTYFRTDDGTPWSELLTFTEGEDDVPQITNPRIGLIARAPTDAYVADFDYFEILVADEQPIYGPQLGTDVEPQMFAAQFHSLHENSVYSCRRPSAIQRAGYADSL